MLFITTGDEEDVIRFSDKVWENFIFLSYKLTKKKRKIHIKTYYMHAMDIDDEN